MAQAEMVKSSHNGQVADLLNRGRFETADRCEARGEIGALLRRERDAQDYLLAALGPKKRGPKLSVTGQQARELAQSQRENERLRQAEALIDVKKS